MLVAGTKKLEGIDPKSWEHPADKAALSALKQMKGLSELIKLLISVTTERSLKLMALASSIKVTENQYPGLHTIARRVTEIFDWDYTPDLFVTQSPFWNAGVIGVQEPFIIINNAMLNGLDEKELTSVVAHEMGHIMSGHSLYKTLLWMLTNISLQAIPMAGLIVLGIKAALYEWDRKSELTADRAGLLAVQDGTTSYNLLMKMAGAHNPGDVNLNELFAQAQEYESKQTLLDSAHKFLNQLWESHPFPVVRLQELKAWEASGQYKSILEGNYIRKNSASGNTAEDIQSGFEYYKESWKKNGDPVSNFVNDVSDGLGKAADTISEKLKDFLNQ
ncbi:M48 family metallopeptidase [Breznakiella homolactica]|uniref:M48 family metallopeptidase n=1 Tax=Breznakiella homolactica TaxID=2798577 RepID=A0A7T7XP90_9SPIR|nr:M48 family metallopeptidase [Breznakiella homolactica]QQO09953.1 M48 family metallopeptidase [Breznakiella homolactica]